MYPISSATNKSGTPFLFLGNHLALDFLNTKPKIDGEFVELLPDFAALLQWFQAASLLGARSAQRLDKSSDTPHGHKVFQQVLHFRETLRHAVVAWEAGEAVPRAFIERVNTLMAAHPMLLRVNSSASSELWFQTEHPNDLFAPLAHAAARLFTDEDRTRVRQCGSCVLHFLDTSKKGSRHWCSMQVCGNRAKVAAFAMRQRGD